MQRNQQNPTRRRWRWVLLLAAALLLSPSLGKSGTALPLSSEAPAAAEEVTAKAAENDTAKERLMLSPGGMSFGVKLSTKGVLVVGFARAGQGIASPAEEAGLHTKDIIEKINGKTVNTVAEVISFIEGSGGKSVKMTVNRAGETLTVSFCPRQDENGVYKAGIWVRDSTAGIGTVTAVNPENGTFIGLGHGICDGDTGVLLPLLRANVYDIAIVAVRKGKAGAPGELKGYFSSALSGILFSNTASGVSGRFTKVDKNALYPTLPVAYREEVHEGDATILCTLTDGVTTEYRVKIVKITDPQGDCKNFVIEVTDPILLEQTGGIVQGMSGSPILQDGRLIGAVTHVMVNEPTKGYGIFIDNMLNQMGDQAS